MTITPTIPVEIAAVLRGARMAGNGRIIAVMQPHRYTRLQALFNEFSACLDDADIVVVTPVYSAGEAPIPGIDRDELGSGLRRHGHPHVLTVDDEEALTATIASIAKPGDLVVGFGAGTITDWINALAVAASSSTGARRERRPACGPADRRPARASRPAHGGSARSRTTPGSGSAARRRSSIRPPTRPTSLTS